MPFPSGVQTFPTIYKYIDSGYVIEDYYPDGELFDLTAATSGQLLFVPARNMLAVYWSAAHSSGTQFTLVSHQYPQIGEVYVNFTTGDFLFNVNETETQAYFVYTGHGSLVTADFYNDVGDTLEAIQIHLLTDGSGLPRLDELESSLADHIADTENPHSVTWYQVGADPSGHTHDDRYYTETEVDDLLSYYATLVQLAGVSGEMAAHIADTDNPHVVNWYQTGAAPSGDYATLAQLFAISGEMSTHINNYNNPHQVSWYQVGASQSGHDHDERYYTESEVDALIAAVEPSGLAEHLVNYNNPHQVDWYQTGAAPSSHIHDDRYYTESEVDALIAGISGGNEFTDIIVTNEIQNDLGDYVTVQQLTDMFEAAIGINAIVDGAVVTWDTGLTFDISSAEYYIQGTRYSSTAQQVTLASGDPNFARIDAILLDVSGIASVLEGVPSANPQQPVPDPLYYLSATFIVVAAQATSPEVTQTDVYFENVEWTTSVSGGTIIANATTDPYEGTYHIQGTNSNVGHYVNFAAGGDFNASAVTSLSLFIKCTAAWDPKRWLRVGLRHSGGLVSSWVTITNGSYGLDTSDTTNYQLVAIPIGDFALTSNVIDEIRIEVTGSGGPSTTMSFRADNIKLQSGAPPTSTKQNLWLSIQGDTGLTSATSPTDLLRIIGAGGISVGVTDKLVTVDGTSVTGTQGDTGIQGPQGDTGVTGSQGDTGATGSQGDTGIQGAKGDTGTQGIQGDTGAGVQGDTGTQGPQGDTGLPGADAVAGKLPSTYVELASPQGTTSATLEDVPGMSGYITLEEAVEIGVFVSIEAGTQSGGSYSVLGVAIDVNGTTYDEYQRYLSGTNDYGMGAITHRTGELAAGTYPVKLKFRRVEGIATPGLNHADMLIVAMQGAKGEQGDTGVTGDKGDTGTTGPQGDTGVTGSQGDTGTKGDTGDKGDTGTGTQGDTGVTGDQGDTGIQGDTGVATGGTTVFIGTSPPPSPDPSGLWWDSNTGKMKIYYYDGDSYQWVDTNQGSIGPSGEQGDTGITGDTGIQGDTGVAGAGITWLGAWNSGSTYNTNDAVSYSNSSYISNQDSNTNHLPTDPSWWDEWVMQGDTGAKGDTGTQGDTGAGVQGDTGIQGDTGVAGSQGDTGVKGDTGAGIQGDTGVTGSQGDTGVKGDTGDAGAKGDTGTAGTQGDTGVTGSQGDTGVKGDTGTQGIQGDTGVQGNQGDTGVKGDTGTPGTQGDTGVTGSQGDTGVKGDTGADSTVPGPQGDTGAKGDTGAGVQGDTGVQGPQGDTGVKGDTGAGVQGDTGVTGPQGDTGVKGDTGADSTVPGPQGDTGVTGAQGDTGVKGDTGTGVQGDTGVTGAQGDTGVKGDTGTQGAQGDTGADSTVPGPQGDTGVKGDTGAQGDKGDTGTQGIQGDTGVTGSQGDTGAKGDTGTQGEKGDTGTQGIQGDTGVTGSQGDTGVGDTGIKGDTGDKGDTGTTGTSAVNQYSITVLNPAGSEDICMGYTAVAITVTNVYAVIKGTSCTIDPYHNTDRSGGGGATDILDNATAITSTTTGQNLTTFTDATIPSGSWVVLATTAATACTELTVTIKYTVD